jgi:hypothetical protein
MADALTLGEKMAGVASNADRNRNRVSDQERMTKGRIYLGLGLTTRIFFVL